KCDGRRVHSCDDRPLSFTDIHASFEGSLRDSRYGVERLVSEGFEVGFEIQGNLTIAIYVWRYFQNQTEILHADLRRRIVNRWPSLLLVKTRVERRGDWILVTD